MTAANAAQLIGPLLRDVSRSFYLTLRVLPPEIRPQISLAYLLARASDTIADTKAVAQTERVAILREFLTNRRRFVAGTAETTAERTLLQRLDDCFAMLATFSADDQQRIRELLTTITSGQIFDLERFPGESAGQLVALADGKELDRYTYLVAGCVGEFWTKMCRAHLPELAGWNGTMMEELGVRFGKGLQLVNILRDLPKDLRIGRCYLPVTKPERLLAPENFVEVNEVYDHWLDVAVAHLIDGWHYTLQIPDSRTRLRLACVWPIWIGMKTIARLRAANPLDAKQRVKVSRGEVYAIMLRTWWLRRDTAQLDHDFSELRAAASRGSRALPE